ncbi:MAG: hypothetical protein HY791_11615 [Deltaproteobacteria bacterium]|nr:hypothetical protein [Deltaproteobacteria bacterium]
MLVSAVSCVDIIDDFPERYTGLITDESVRPLAGVRVSCNECQPEVSDSDGRYEVSTRNGPADYLVFEAVGFESLVDLSPDHYTSVALRQSGQIEVRGTIRIRSAAGTYPIGMGGLSFGPEVLGDELRSLLCDTLVESVGMGSTTTVAVPAAFVALGLTDNPGGQHCGGVAVGPGRIGCFRAWRPLAGPYSPWALGRSVQPEELSRLLDGAQRTSCGPHGFFGKVALPLLAGGGSTRAEPIEFLPCGELDGCPVATSSVQVELVSGERRQLSVRVPKVTCDHTVLMLAGHEDASNRFVPMDIELVSEPPACPPEGELGRTILTDADQILFAVFEWARLESFAELRTITMPSEHATEPAELIEEVQIELGLQAGEARFLGISPQGTFELRGATPLRIRVQPGIRADFVRFPLVEPLLEAFRSYTSIYYSTSDAFRTTSGQCLPEAKLCRLIDRP